MKIFIPVSLILALLIFQGFKGHESKSNFVFAVSNCDSIPKLNKQIVAYAKTKIGRKVETGQCWDFAAEALKTVGAKWDGRYVFGKKADPETDCIYPGDMIQFEGVQVEYGKNGGRFIESMGHHTAIIYKVNAKGNYELAHQNFGYSGKKVGITNLDLKNITKGEYLIFRPVK
ncbi:MAG: CHAP domain-containing protein [Bacteroidia bacterium]